MPTDQEILLNGAAGYIGGRLLALMMEDGRRVRYLGRHPERLSSRLPARREAGPGDVLDSALLSAAMQGIATAHHLVHIPWGDGRS